MDKIRLANEQEIKGIAEYSELIPGSTIFVFENSIKENQDVAVLRPVLELDPIIYSSNTNTRRKVAFIWSLENGMRMTGITRYYFNISAKDEDWQRNVESWGATKTSPEPEFRYRKVL